MKRNPAGQIAQEMAQVRRRNGGTLTPASVLKFARSHPKSAIYSRIDRAGLWADDKAAEKGRLLFCQKLILQVRVRMLVNGKKVSTRTYVSIITDRREGGGYVSVVQAMRTKQGREAVLATALAEFVALERKYRTLQELGPIFASIRNVQSILLDKEEAA